MTEEESKKIIFKFYMEPQPKRKGKIKKSTMLKILADINKKEEQK